jgi:hypothetical protein
LRVDAAGGGFEMTRTQLNHQVARITGEPIGNIAALGFSLLGPGGECMEPEDIRLVLECPFCGRTVPYPGPGAAGSEPIAECERCDVDFLPQDVHDIPIERPRRPNETLRLLRQLKITEGVE